MRRLVPTKAAFTRRLTCVALAATALIVPGTACSGREDSTAEAPQNVAVDPGLRRSLSVPDAAAGRGELTSRVARHNLTDGPLIDDVEKDQGSHPADLAVTGEADDDPLTAISAGSQMICGAVVLGRDAAADGDQTFGPALARRMLTELDGDLSIKDDRLRSIVGTLANAEESDPVIVDEAIDRCQYLGYNTDT